MCPKIVIRINTFGGCLGGVFFGDDSLVIPFVGRQEITSGIMTWLDLKMLGI